VQYLGEIKQVKANAISSELQSAIIKALPRAVQQVKPFAEKFRGANDTETARNVWKFLRTQITYERDKPEAQRIFLPSSFLHFKKGDCKSFATFAAAIFSALQIPNGYHFTSYKSRTTPSHIYNFIRLSNGKHLPVDGCFSKFGIEKKPSYISIHKLNYR
jgi:hypothetical protein